MYACIHQCQCAGAYGSHRRRTVGFQNVRYNAHYVGIAFGNLAFQRAPCQVSVSDFAAAYATLCFGLTCRERGEVVVQQEAFLALVQHIVHDFLVILCAQCYRSQCLCLATGEDGRAVRAGQGRNLAPDGTDFRRLAAVQAFAFIEDATTHGLFLHVVIVTVDKRCLFFQFFFSELSLELFANGIEGILTLVLVTVSAGGNGVCLVVAGIVYGLTQVFVVHFVAVFALYSRADFFGQLHLCLTHGLDSLVGSFQGSQQILFGHFFHFAFHHHDVLVGGTYHQVHVGLFQLLEGGVDDELSVDAGYTHFSDGTSEGDV